MGKAIGPEILLYAVTALMLFFSAYAMANRRIRGATEFSALMASAGIYALGYGLELAQDELGSILAAIYFEYLGIATAPAFWLLFALTFTRTKKLPRSLKAAVLVIPCIVIASAWTNDFHHLYYAKTWVDRTGPFPVFGFEQGPLYWLQFFYLELCLAAGTAVVLIHAFRSPRQIRRQSIMAAFGASLPWLGTVLYALDFVPWGLDPTAFILSISGVAFSLSIFRLGFLQVVPAARDKAIESLRDGFIVIDDGGMILDSNEAARKLLAGWPINEGEILGERGPKEGEEAASLGEIRKLLGTGTAEFEHAFGLSKDKPRRLAFQSFPVQFGKRGKKGKGILIRDVTENAALLSRLSDLAGTDELTGLSNRRRFQEFASKEFAFAVRDGRHVAVAILDIDHFKDVNDRFGHAAGDLALKEFTARLTENIREADILCRYGGEEFAVLLPGAEPESAFTAIERVRVGAVIPAIAWNGTSFPIKSSAGVYSAVPGKASTLDAFLDQADSALYEAKTAGRDRTVLRKG